MFSFQFVSQVIESIVSRISLNTSTNPLIKSNTESIIDENNSKIEVLPNEILIKIFECLDFKTKMKAQLVCERWKRLIESSFDIKSDLLIQDMKIQLNFEFGDFKPYGITNCKDLSVFDLKDMKPKLSGRKSYKTYISRIIGKHSNIKVLYLCLKDCQLKKNLLKSITDCLESDLRHLSVITAEKKLIISAEDVENFCPKFPNLKTFQFEVYDLFIQQKSITFMIKMWQKLKVFILLNICDKKRGKYKSKKYNGFCFEDISHDIKVIGISGLVFNGIAVSMMANKNISTLDKLRIENLDGIQTIVNICQEFSSLSSLQFSLFNTINAETDGSLMMESIAKLVNLKKLKLLIDSNKPILRYNQFKLLENSKNLISLTIESTQMTTESIKAISKFMPQLLKLKLIDIDFEYNSDDSIIPIKHLKCLKHLELSANPGITNNSVIKIIKSCHNLQFIDLSKSELISINTLHSLMAFALRNPRQEIKIVFSIKLENDIKKMDQFIPKNLTLYYKE